MKRFVSILAAILVSSILPAGRALAFDNAWASLVVHVTAPTAKNVCQLPGLTASTIQSSGFGLAPDQFHFSYLVVCNASDSTGVAGVENGIQYSAAIQVYSWNLCGDLEFPSTGWPASGGGNLMTWDADNNCQRDNAEGLPHTVTAVAGFFYMGAYTPASLQVTPRPVSGRFKVADCSAREDDLTGAFPSHMGIAGFGGQSGYNPCAIVDPVEPTTWGAIKSFLR